MKRLGGKMAGFPGVDTRNSGVPGLGEVPLGSHICGFYGSREELLDVLVPYFEAGLACGDACVWATSEGGCGPKAIELLRARVEGFADHLESGRIIMVENPAWYLPGGRLDPASVLSAFREMVKGLLDGGAGCVRAAGELSFPLLDRWDDILAYERGLEHAVRHLPVLVFCAYPAGGLDAVRAAEVASAHGMTVGAVDGGLRSCVSVTAGRSAVQAAPVRATAPSTEQLESGYFRVLVDHIEDIITVCRTDGTIEFVGPSIKRIMGFDPEELVGHNALEFMNPEEADRVTPMLPDAEEMLSDSRNFTWRFRHRDGSWRYVEGSVRLLDGPDGEKRVMATSRDVTDRVTMQRELNLKAEMLDKATDSIFLQGFDLRFKYVNEAASGMLGYSSGELMEMGVLDVDTMEYPERMEALVRQLTERGEGLLESVNRRKDGTTIPVEVHAHLVELGGEQFMLSLVRDITERKRVEDELQRYRDELEQLVARRTAELVAANRELEGYSHVVSHDLRSPLAAVLLAIESLAEHLEKGRGGSPDAQAVEMLELIERNVLKATNLAQDLLVLAEAGQVPTNLQDVDLREVLALIAAERGADIASAGARIEPGENLGTVRASETHIYQLLGNLVGNALEHCDSENPVIEVRRLEDSASGGGRYLVRDNGFGVPDDLLDEVFEPFRRGPGGRTGIGLTIVDKIVRIYGGTVRAYNDGGACFEFEIHDYPG